MKSFDVDEGVKLGDNASLIEALSNLCERRLVWQEKETLPW